MNELILECEIKYKKVRCQAFIGGCKTGVIHRLLIEFILIIKTKGKHFFRDDKCNKDF